MVLAAAPSKESTWGAGRITPAALGPAAPLPVAAAPPSWRPAARAHGRPARALLRPGRGRACRPGRPPPGRAPDMAWDRRVHRGVHAGVDRLGERQPAP